MGVTFRDRGDVERGELGPDGRLQNFAPIERDVPMTFWETLVKRVAIEGETFEAVAETLIHPDSAVKRRDVLVVRDRRWEVLTAFPGRNLAATERFIHLTLRQAV